MGSLSHFLDTAAARKVVPTDLAACALGAIAVAAVLVGTHLPADAAGLAGLWLTVTLLSVLALRLLTAFQALRDADARPAKGARRHGRAFLEHAYQSARTEFAKDLELYLEPMSQAFVMANFNVETIARLNKRASLFMTDRSFNPLWTRFVTQFEHEAKVAYYDLDREVDEEAAVQVSRNLNHCFQVRRAIVQALIECLTYQDGFDERLNARLARIEKEFSALGMADLFADKPAETPAA